MWHGIKEWDESRLQLYIILERGGPWVIETGGNVSTHVSLFGAGAVKTLLYRGLQGGAEG